MKEEHILPEESAIVQLVQLIVWLTDVTSLVVKRARVGRGGKHSDPRIALTKINHIYQSQSYYSSAPHPTLT